MRPRNIPFRVVASLFLLFLLASNPPSYGQMAEEILGKLGSLPQRERQERLIEGAKKEGEITIYLTMSLGDFTLLVKEFKKTYPFLAVKHLRKSGTALLQIAISEKRANRYFPDLFLGIWSGLWSLMQQQLVGKYNSPENRFYDDHYKDVNGQWTAFQASSRLFAYNTTLVKKSKLPRNYFDLLDPYWKGKLSLDTNAPHWTGAMIKAMGKEGAIKYFHRLKSQRLQLRRGHTLRANLLVAGEFPAMIETSPHTIVRMKNDGAPVDYVYLDGTAAWGGPISLARFAPHPHSAALFIDFVLSEKGMSLLRDLQYVPTRKGMDPKDPELAERVKKAKLTHLTPEWFGQNLLEVYSIFNSIFLPGRR